MNVAMVTSYIIAGMILISILMMNLRMSTSGAELTLTQITREYVRNVTDMLNEDIPNIGYDIDKITRDPFYSDDEMDKKVIIEVDEHRFRFYRNLCGTRTQNLVFEGYNVNCDRPEIITWEYLEEQPESSQNPNHGTLVRTVEFLDGDGVVEDIRTNEIELGVTKFNLSYNDTLGGSVNMTMPILGNALYDIKQIYVELEMQSNERISGATSSEGRYIRSVWEKRFTPRNLEF